MSVKEYFVILLAIRKTKHYTVVAGMHVSFHRGEGGQGGMEVGEEGDYIPIATLSPPE